MPSGKHGRAVDLAQFAGVSAVLGFILSVVVGASHDTYASTVRVRVAADGSFSPASVRIRPGDTIEWSLPGKTHAIVTAASAPAAPGQCPAPRAFSSGDRSDFTGPLPFAPSGVFSLGPLEDRGLGLVKGACPGGRSPAIVDGVALCAVGPAFTTMDDTWADPNTDGVFIRLLWNRVQTGPGPAASSFDFSDLDREITQAVRHGKLYSLAIKAGNEGTPDWIFANGVKRLDLQDGGEASEIRACGPKMTLGSPTDPKFEKLYFDMLTAVAAHIRSRADWFRALAYIKPSGANLFSHENRLPKRCSPGCVCNPQVFATNGYTPSRLYDFYRRQFALMKKEFPGKAISYALIQDGFPLVNDSGGWETADGRSSNGKPLPQGTEQTERIIEIGQSELGPLFVVQHNGLQVFRADCEATTGRRGGRAAIAANRGNGCPNRWVLRAGVGGQTVTGFQTQNMSDISTPADVDLAFKNLIENSEGVFIELYEGPLWLAVHANKGVLPSRKTVGGWGAELDERRLKLFNKLGDPYPKTYRYTFSGANPGTLYYFDPSACRATGSPVGTIVVEK